jgi:hypothetical protein
VDGGGVDPKTEELRVVQTERESTERSRAEETPDPTEELTHERRADRAAYLREKLDEQAESQQQ